MAEDADEPGTPGWAKTPAKRPVMVMDPINITAKAPEKGLTLAEKVLIGIGVAGLTVAAWCGFRK